MRALADACLALLIPGLILLHLYVAPYSKVEESFNLQATHDILTYGIPTKLIPDRLRAEYDHFTFPGAVPRTFVGSVILAGLSRPFLLLGDIDRQLLVRGILGLINAAGLLCYYDAVRKAYGRDVGRWFVLLQASQFHVIYYASRTLPNMFAFGLTTLALRCCLPTPVGNSKISVPKRTRLCIYLLTLAGVIFRSELAILLGTTALYLLYQGRARLVNDVIRAGMAGATIGLLTTVSIDSFFWQKFPLWPELAGFYFNAIEGKSSEWGTSPWHFYLSNAIPRLLMNPMTWLVCIPLAVSMPATRRSSLDLLVPTLAFAGIYSVQPHKEWRFVVYLVPAVTAAAALGAAWIWNRKTKSAVYGVLAIALAASVLGSFAASFGMLAVSSLNYPGAQALARVHQLADDGGARDVVSVHLDTLSCMTGVTRFLQLPDPSDTAEEGRARWVYDKTEDPRALLEPLFWTRFDYALMEEPEKALGNWEVVDVVDGLAGITLLRPGEGAEERGSGEVTLAASVKNLKSSVQEAHSSLSHLWKEARDYLRERVTKGWWIGVKMTPKIRIMKKLPGQA